MWHNLIGLKKIYFFSEVTVLKSVVYSDRKTYLHFFLYSLKFSRSIIKLEGTNWRVDKFDRQNASGNRTESANTKYDGRGTAETASKICHFITS